MYITAFSVPQGVVTVLLVVFNTLSYLFSGVTMFLVFQKPMADSVFTMLQLVSE